MSDLDEIIIDGQPRKMGRTPPTENNLKMRAGLTSFTEYLRSKGLGLIPRSEWAPTTRRNLFTLAFINDQGQHGSCVGFSGAQSEMKERALRGESFNVLSGSWLYDQINGGQDNGASITDSMGVLMSKGIPLAADYPKEPQFNTRLQPASMSRFKEELCLTLTAFDEMVTAILMGLIVQYPVQVGASYNRFDSDGVCGFSRGQGNHSVLADGLAFVSNRWLLDNPGTWGTNAGPWKNGRFYHSEQAIMGCAVGDDAYVKIVPRPDPQGTQPGVVA